MHENFKPKALRNCRRILELNYRTSLPAKNGYSFFSFPIPPHIRYAHKKQGREKTSPPRLKKTREEEEEDERRKKKSWEREEKSADWLKTFRQSRKASYYYAEKNPPRTMEKSGRIVSRNPLHQCKSVANFSPLNSVKITRNADYAEREGFQPNDFHSHQSGASDRTPLYPPHPFHIKYGRRG